MYYADNEKKEFTKRTYFNIHPKVSHLILIKSLLVYCLDSPLIAQEIHLQSLDSDCEDIDCVYGCKSPHTLHL